MAVIDDEGNDVTAPESETAEEAQVEETEEATEEQETEEESSTEEESEESDNEDADDEKPAHQKGEVYQKRIDKLVAQRNEARDKLTAAETRVKELEERVGDSIELHTDYLTKDELARIKQAKQLMGREEFLMMHLTGYDDDEDPSKSLTAKQVAQELVQIRRMSDEITDAQRLYRERKAQQLEDMRNGRLLRLSKKALKKTEVKPKTTIKTVTTASSSPKAVTTQPKRGQNVERFLKSGGGEDAAARELAELVPD